MSIASPPPTSQAEATAPATAVSPTGRATFGVLAHRPTRRRGGLRFTQSIPSALEALRANKGRAILTTLGIVIGVAAVISIVALGQGSSASVTSRLAGLGTNVLTLSNASSRSSGIAAGAGPATP